MVRRMPVNVVNRINRKKVTLRRQLERQNFVPTFFRRMP